MPLLKPKDDKPKKGVEITKFDMIKCCMCKPKVYKPSVQEQPVGGDRYWCKNCGYQLTFKQINEFHGSPEYKKQKASMKSK